MNDFVKVNTMGAGTALTEKGALSYASTGSKLINQFSKAGSARGRDLYQVWAEQSELWAENPTAALKFPFYLRLITRQAQLPDGTKTTLVQKGQGAKDEAFKRLLWIAKYLPEDFYKNLWLLPIVGSWKDLWVLLTMDDSLDKSQFFALISEGITNESSRELVKKYLPRIRSEKKCTSEWAKKTNQLAKEFAKFAGWSFEEYRKFKATGIAHEFQRIICQGPVSKINWGTVPGKALLSLVNGNFIEKHDLIDSYLSWLETQSTVKFNGYPYELGNKLSDCRRTGKQPSLALVETIDKQFESLIKTATKDCGPLKGNVLCALDTSGSMNAPIAPNTSISAFDVCISLGIYFSELNTGAFHNVVAMFDGTSRLKTIEGSFCQKWSSISKDQIAWGTTDLTSIWTMLNSTRRKHPEIPLSDYPDTILVVSDMQFDPVAVDGEIKTNSESAVEMLKKEFPDSYIEKLKIIWWNCTGRLSDVDEYPATMEQSGMYMFSGYDGSIVSLLLTGERKIDEKTGKEIAPTMKEIVDKALSQEVLSLVQLAL